MPEAALVAVRNETIHIFKITLDLIGLVFHLNQSKAKEGSGFFSELLFNTKKDKTPADLFNNILSTNKSIMVFASKIPVHDLEELERRELAHYNNMVITLSQVAKTVINIGPEIEEIESSENTSVSQLMILICDTTNSNLVLLHKILEESLEKQTLEVYNNQIKQDYKMVVEKIAEAIEKKLIQEKDISLLLMVNGMATQTIRQLFRTLEKLI
ncbi:MAG TPA: hypothetical protein PLL09_07130 [Flavobacterium sp.]|uniref:hypothetical protein n=1 Tax=unclassified Flavobacterium TaxID=196869 RepID=UPI0025BF435A|nr:MULTISPECIES: hypothetical protein [unclassified Flavobacterium]HRE77581.1 hypothetical protein [Flavobacterium sp.]